MFVDIYNTENKYDVLYADPPWNQSKGGKKNVRENSSGAKLDYPTLPLCDIQSILHNACKHTNENSILFLWTIDKYLFEAQRMAELEGYKLHARMIWNKVTGIPAAFTVRFGHEYLLYMYKDKLLPVAKEERGKIHTVFSEQVTKHSKKPVIAYEIVERLYPTEKKLELFAREKRNGWSCWGNDENIQDKEVVIK